MLNLSSHGHVFGVFVNRRSCRKPSSYRNSDSVRQKLYFLKCREHLASWKRPFVERVPMSILSIDSLFLSDCPV